MAVLAVQSINRLGAAPAYAAAAAGGDQVLPGTNTFLHVKNASAAAITVTAASQGVDALARIPPNIAVSVPAAGERLIGPFPNQGFADPVSGNVLVTYSAVVSLTVGAFAVSQP